MRLGHKTREAAMDELDDDIDEPRVRRILAEIGYSAESETRDEARLLAYFVPGSSDVDAAQLRAHLAETLPHYMLPSAFVALVKAARSFQNLHCGLSGRLRVLANGNKPVPTTHQSITAKRAAEAALFAGSPSTLNGAT